MIAALRALAGRYRSAPLPRLILVSAAQNGLFYLLALGELAIGFKSWQTFAVNYPLAVALSFLTNRFFVFEGRERRRGQFGRYVAVYVAAYIGSMALAEALERLGVAPAFAIILTMVPTAVFLFLALNFWVFPKADADA